VVASTVEITEASLSGPRRPRLLSLPLALILAFVSFVATGHSASAGVGVIGGGSHSEGHGGKAFPAPDYVIGRHRARYDQDRFPVGA
jgi:hypothetical protein